jgi:peptidoglycan/LPS O-acetylase OafA/YrhL
MMKTESKKTRIGTLDGWRGTAIMLVIMSHAATWSRFHDRLWASEGIGNLGVDIFFVVSGYIITLRLLKELDKTSAIRLRHFYMRRAFRILPLVCSYLFVLILLSSSIRLPDFRRSEIIGSLLFFRNYQMAATQQGHYTVHFWSLAVEEHFYLGWPILLLWLGKRRGLWFALAGAAACAAWRLYDCTHPNTWIGRILPGQDNIWIRQTRTDARLDGILLGCAVAILLTMCPVRSFIQLNFPKETPLLGALLLILNVKRAHGWPTLTSYLLICLVLASTLLVEEGLAYKWLNSRMLVWIGTISYSAYIWQQLFLTRIESFRSPFGKSGFFPLNLVCVLAISTLSFYLIERPCIAFGARLLGRRRAQITEVSNV